MECSRRGWPHSHQFLKMTVVRLLRPFSSSNTGHVCTVCVHVCSSQRHKPGPHLSSSLWWLSPLLEISKCPASYWLDKWMQSIRKSSPGNNLEFCLDDLSCLQKNRVTAAMFSWVYTYPRGALWTWQRAKVAANCRGRGWTGIFQSCQSYGQLTKFKWSRS